MITKQRPSWLSICGAMQLMLAGWEGHLMWVHWNTWPPGDRISFSLMFVGLLGQGLLWTIWRRVEPERTPEPLAPR